MSSRALILGTNENYFDEEVDDQSRTEHMHVMGATGSGKSRFLLSLIIQDIINRKGVCLIDPHGELVSHVVDWLSKNEHITQRRTVKLLQLRDTEHSFGFNPLMVQDRSSAMEINGVVARTVSALAAISGDDGFDGAPLLDKTLTAVCTGLATAGLTLVEADFLLTPQFHSERQQIISHIKDPVHRREWDALDQLAKSNPKLYQEQFQAAERRISNLIRDPLLRNIIGQQARNLDVKACMDDREIILVDLSRQGNVVTERSARTFGRFLINALTERAFERNPRDKAPFHLYIDEAHNYLSENIPTILAECRKYGLHLTLAHQNLQQMREAGDAVFHGVMANARNKIVFQLEYPEDAQIMQRRIFAGKYDFMANNGRFYQRLNRLLKIVLS
ncbi:MAG: type IV secretory system conjugative DNA transfer family protein, partial [Pseudomonadota bacterium]